MHLGMHFRFHDPRRSQVAPMCDSYSTVLIWSPFRAFQWARRDLPALAHHTAFLTFPIPLLLGGPLVMGLLALGEADLELGPSLAPVHGGGDDGIALAFHGADEPRQLLSVQQELAGAGGVRVYMGGGGDERGDERAQEEGLPVLDDHIA